MASKDELQFSDDLGLTDLMPVEALLRSDGYVIVVSPKEYERAKKRIKAYYEEQNEGNLR